MASEQKKTNIEPSEQKTCGLVMPISPIDGQSAEHWAEVKGILEQVANEAGFETKLVSTATVSGLLPANIVTNLYKNDIVICDVSGRNPNVMFELGLRLAFDKPTIIVKDDATEYTFDIQSIGHLEYPRSLRITKMEIFKEVLSRIIVQTYQRKIEDPSYSTFLKHYQIFEAKGLETSSDFHAFVADGFDNIMKEISFIKTHSNKRLSATELNKQVNISSDSELETYNNMIVRNTIKDLLKDETVNWRDFVFDEERFEELRFKVNNLLELIGISVSAPRLLTELAKISK